MIYNFFSYFNPVSTGHKDVDTQFSNLESSKKITVVALSSLAAVATFFVLGLGGIATYRFLTERFTPQAVNPSSSSVAAVAARTLSSHNDITVLNMNRALIEHFKSNREQYFKLERNNLQFTIQFYNEPCFALAKKTLTAAFSELEKHRKEIEKIQSTLLDITQKATFRINELEFRVSLGAIDLGLVNSELMINKITWMVSDAIKTCEYCKGFYRRD